MELHNVNIYKNNGTARKGDINEGNSKSEVLVPIKKTEENLINNSVFTREIRDRKESDKAISPFIEANTKEVEISHLKNDCIIPVFAKDNERTIAHHEFVEATYNGLRNVLKDHTISSPELRISHGIKGRTPNAINKQAKDLLKSEKTVYYERMAFIMRIPSITEVVNGNELSLVVGGVRAYNKENLMSRKGIEKFQIFIGFQNLVCCNLCISTDGLKNEIRVTNIHELQSSIVDLVKNYQIQNHLNMMKDLSSHHLTEHQFAQLIGKSKLFPYLPKRQKEKIPEFSFKDSQVNTVAKDYYQDESFSRDDDGNINLWNLYNLFTSANKSSYIDTFLSRDVNALNLTKGLSKAINGSGNYHWFLS